MESNKEEKIFQELEKELKEFDWFYEYADDQRYWKKGNEARKRIIPLLKECMKIPSRT